MDNEKKKRSYVKWSGISADCHVLHQPLKQSSKPKHFWGQRHNLSLQGERREPTTALSMKDSWQADKSFAFLPLTLSPLFNQKGSQFCCFFFSFFTPLSWENLPELIHRSQHMNFQSGISRIFQCGSSFVNLASIACVVGKGNVNRIWSLGQGIASLISKKDFKNRAHLVCSMSVMFLWFWSVPSISDHQKTPRRHGPLLLSCILHTQMGKHEKWKETMWFQRAAKEK